MPAMRFVLLSIIAGFVLWITTFLPFDVELTGGEEEWWKRALVFAAAGAVMAALHLFIKPIVDVLALPLRILTLGIFSLLIAYFMLWLTSWLTGFISWMELSLGGFWDTLFASIAIALIVGILSMLIPGAQRD